jgi:hypothetical protein
MTDAASASLPPGLPAWLQELDLLRTACPHFLVTGNCADLHMVPAALAADHNEGTSFSDIENILNDTFRRTGHEVVIHFDIVRGVHYSADPEEDERIAGRAHELLDLKPGAVARAGELEGLASLIEAVVAATPAVAMVIHDAARLLLDVTHLSEPEFQLFRRVNLQARRAGHGEGRSAYNPVVWLLRSERELPEWFVVNNHRVRQLTVPLPDTDVRRTAAEKLIRTLPEGPPSHVDPAEVLARQTSGFTLEEMRSVVRLAKDRGLNRHEIDDAVRSYRVGVLDNPWRRPYIADRLRKELGPAPALPERVLGQSRAVRRSVDILVRSAAGLTAAHASASATRPRGVLFFAGPTGVGKTELAKALTELLFEDEAAYIRFDMSEFSSEHAADRLIGSPPGYVGHDAGGELTNAIRARPFSLVLFDEIEKADARILDKFLQILEDGRLTDGQGETVHFTEAVIVFTTNLGVYVEDDLGNRKLNINPQMRPDQMQETLTAAIRNHFTIGIGRPELLNRLGDNIVVFNFISQETGEQIFDLMIRRVVERVAREQALALTIASEPDTWLREQCLTPEVLELGGRGIGNILETKLVNPLARALFLHRSRLGAEVTLAGLSEVDDVVEAELA